MRVSENNQMTPFPLVHSYTWKDKDEHIEVALQTTWSTLSHDKVYVEVINKRQLKCFVARSALKHFTIYVGLYAGRNEYYLTSVLELEF